MSNKENEYATSAQRRYGLAQMVIEGEEADIVLKYAKRFKEQAKEDLLSAIADDDDSVSKAIVHYRAVCSFVDMLKNLVANGEKKRNTLQGLKQ